MGQKVTSPLRENMNSIHAQMMKHAGADYDIATATTLSYNQFVEYIMELNKICNDFKDKHDCVLVFAVKKGTDSSMFWKATVRIACVKLDTKTNKVDSHRLLNIRQFLQVFRRITYECKDVSKSPAQASSIDEASSATVPPTMAASMILGDGSSSEPKGKCSKEETNLEECVICLERKPEVSLPCCHAYCVPCIEQWWEYCENSFEDECLARNLIEQMNTVDRSCPICRDSCSSTEDTWVLPDVPNQSEVNDEIRKALISFATTNKVTD